MEVDAGMALVELNLIGPPLMPCLGLDQGAVLVLAKALTNAMRNPD